MLKRKVINLKKGSYWPSESDDGALKYFKWKEHWRERRVQNNYYWIMWEGQRGTSKCHNSKFQQLNYHHQFIMENQMSGRKNWANGET